MDAVKHSLSEGVKHRLIHVERLRPQNQAMLQGRALGLFLKSRAHAMGVRNSQLAEAADVSQQAVGAWFKTGRISRESLSAIASLLRSSPDALLAGNKEPVQAELPLTDDQSHLLKLWGLLSSKQRSEELARLEEVAASNVDLVRQLGHIAPAIDRPVSNEKVAKHLGAVPGRSVATKELKR